MNQDRSQGESSPSVHSASTKLRPIDRREFLRQTGVAAAGLVIAFHIPDWLGKAGGSRALASGAAAPVFPPNAFIRIAPDNKITFLINKSEMGQGVYTSMAQLIAEELDCDFANVSSESAPVAPVYNHTAFGMQMTGGSTALNSSWEQHRRIGATARAMLVSAAAAKWQVPVRECKTESGFVVHAKSKRRASYGELADAANALPMPDPTTIKLKDPKNFRIIGKPIKRIDTAKKIVGKATYGIDVRLPGMQYAVIARPPSFGGSVKSVNDRKARAVPGVTAVIRVPAGVAVVANNTWAATRGRDALSVEWNPGPRADLSTSIQRTEYTKLAETTGASARKASGNPTADLAKLTADGKPTIKADYWFPYLAHATMEPINCTIDFDGTSCRIFVGTHMQTADRNRAAAVLGIPEDKVTLTTTLLGTSFGRRASAMGDFVSDAATLARELKKPVQLVWTREDDTRGGWYRPAVMHRVEASHTDKTGNIAWQHRIVGQSILGGTPFEAFLVKDGIDATSVEGAADTPYEIANMNVELHSPKLPVPVLWWRSVGHSHVAYVMETMIDELAAQAKTDPVKFRLALLKKHPRHVAALKLAAEKSGWGKKKLPKGHAFGVAVHESFGSVVAHVAEVSIVGGNPKVHRVTSGVHCGTVVNPDGARAQIEGGVAYGLSAALLGELTLKNGGVEQGNFDTYRVLQMEHMPRVDVHFVPSTATPTGLGEPGVPPIGPAVANGLFQLTGVRIRELPMMKSVLT